MRRSFIQHFLRHIEPSRIFFVDGYEEFGCRVGSLDDLRKMDRAEIAKLRFVTGHMPVDILDMFEEPFSFTVMRDPVERALSDYWYCYSSPENPGHAMARELSPVEFCRRGFSQASNGHARFLSGAMFGKGPFTDAEMIAECKRALQRISLVGRSEDLSSLCENLALAGWCGILIDRNENAAERFHHLSATDRSAIGEANLLDELLYAAVGR